MTPEAWGCPRKPLKNKNSLHLYFRFLFAYDASAMSLPLALPRPVSPDPSTALPSAPSARLGTSSLGTSRAIFTLPLRRLLGRLPGQPGLWVLREGKRTESFGGALGAARLRPQGHGGHPEASGRLAPPSAGLAHYFLLGALLRGERALFLDAANCFNPHRLAEMIARVNERRQGSSPCPTQAAEELLARVRLSRAFTCFQLAELVERVPAAARRWNARCVFVTGVPEIFDDEELEAAEARRVFLRALEGMRRWRAGERNLKLSTLVFTPVFTQPRALHRWLAAQLERTADGVFRFKETPQGLAVRGGEKLPALCAFSATSACPACPERSRGKRRRRAPLRLTILCETSVSSGPLW